MIFNLKSDFDKQRFKEYCNKLYEEECAVELKKKRFNRTLPQNSYLHVLLSYFASKYGCTADEAKVDFFKRECNLSIFCPNGETRKDGKPKLRSSADLDTAEMALAITRFRNWSAAVAEIYLPSANENEFMLHCQQEIERNKEYI